MADDRAPYPHCNQDVLHAPGRCAYCDMYPDRQELRAAGGTPFTPDESNGWSGNVAAPAGSVHHHMGATWTVPASPSTADRLITDPPRWRTVAHFLPCSLPPRGWYCNLASGHDGPCPAWPTRWTRIRYALRGRRLPSAR